MKLDQQDVIGLIRRRTSCRTYDGEPIGAGTQRRLQAFLDRESGAPFGKRMRLALIAATEDDPTTVRRLGTYGFIKGARAYIAGVVLDAESAGALEDFGYVVERTILYATSLGLGTVWLGGTFTKSRFERTMGLRSGESLPAVIALGSTAERPRASDGVIRRGAQADKRLTWEQLFYEAPPEGGGLFEIPLANDGAGTYATALEMVHIGPSASNKQPWRIVRSGKSWHFYMQRSRRYRSRNSLVRVADMQRIDMGIAMCHFELTALQLGLAGDWTFEDPGLPLPGRLTSHVATWAAR